MAFTGWSLDGDAPFDQVRTFSTLSNAITTYTVLYVTDLDALTPQPPQLGLDVDLFLVQIIDPRFPLVVRMQDLGRVRDCVGP